MAQKRGIANALANKIFQMQRITHGGVPGNIVRAARMIKEGSGGAGDLKLIRNYLGISQSGASQLKQGMRDVNQGIGKFAQAGVLMDVASRGGATGALATAQLINTVGLHIEKMVKKGSFDGVIERAFRKPQVMQGLARTRGATRYMRMLQDKDQNQSGIQFELGNNTSSDSVQKAMDLARLSRVRNGLTRNLRMVGAFASAMYMGYQATSFLRGAGEALGGAGNFEGIREAQQRANILGASRENDYSARRAAEIEVEKQRWKGKVGFLPGFVESGITAARNHIFKKGLESEIQGFHQTRADLNAAGMSGDVQKLRELGRERVLVRESGGLLSGQSSARWDELKKSAGFSDEELEKKISAEVSNTIAKVSNTKGAAYEAAGRREFVTARKLLAEANKELPGSVSAWENPTDIYMRQVGDRAAQRLWSRSQMARAGPRTGD